MFEKIENKWTEDSGDYDDMIQKQLSNKRTDCLDLSPFVF